MIYGQKLPQPKTPIELAREKWTREKLQQALDCGPDNIEVVARKIVELKLPYIIEVSDGTDKFPGIAEGWGVIKDTLSQGDLSLQQFVTVDDDTNQMKEDARKASLTPYEVLIIGETGTGKEIIARSMIANRKGTVKAVNCAGLPEHLVESELFGHVRGSFTGADKDKVGLTEAATDGVMFLDEVGELPMSVQAKLLRAMQEKVIRPVGSNTERAINCKFVCATHRDLNQMVKAGTFREDLFARISALPLTIKALKYRKDDIIPICEAIFKSLKVTKGSAFLAEHGKDLATGTIEVPLNVRSLQQYIIRYETWGRIK